MVLGCHILGLTGGLRFQGGVVRLPAGDERGEAGQFRLQRLLRLLKAGQLIGGGVTQLRLGGGFKGGKSRADGVGYRRTR